MQTLKEVQKREKRKEILDDLGGMLKSYKTNYFEKFDYFSKPEEK